MLPRPLDEANKLPHMNEYKSEDMRVKDEITVEEGGDASLCVGQQGW